MKTTVKIVGGLISLGLFAVMAFGPPPAGSTADGGEPGGTPSRFGGDAVLRDGTYNGTANGFRKQTTVSVTVSEGRVAAIRTVSTADTPSYYARAEKNLSAAITQRQTLKVDAVSGATRSSTGYVNAVRNALTQAVDEGTL